MAVKPINIFRGSTGLNNTVDLTKIKFNPDTGMTDLSLAFNVDIDNNGRVSRRSGFASTAVTNNVHSLWSNGKDCFFMTGQYLYRLEKDYTKTGLRSGMTVGARVSFVDGNFRTYYTNGFENGFIIENTSYVWSAEEYTGPTTTKVFSSPPVGTHLEIHSGRMFVTVNNLLYYSEPFAYSWFNLASNYIWMSKRFRMIRSVGDGLYIGTDNGVFFLSGKNPDEFDFTQITSNPPVEFTDILTDGSDILEGIPGKVVIWTGEDGIWIGASGGQAKNITKDKLTYPTALYGSAYIEDGRYVVLLQE